MQGAGRTSADVLNPMLRALSHRGPDAMGVYESPNFTCGTARLSIIDVAGGHQPLFNEDRSIVAVCNGEIFNYKDLRAKLVANHHRFRTDSDVEVIVHLYEDYDGLEFLNCLNGQFAFAICDIRRQRLIAARDRFGICPLHYAIVDGCFVFASEIKALLKHPAVPRDVDVVALDQVFSLTGIVSPRTILTSVKSLQAGHCLSSTGGFNAWQYWDLNFPSADEPVEATTESELIRNIQELITVAVQRRLQAESAVGVYLSGGLDSSLIARAFRSVAPDAPISSFSIVLDDADFTEKRYQDLVANSLHLDHRAVWFRTSEIADRLKKVIYHCECPLKELHNAGAMALSEYVKANGVKVILSGQGADELFAGYVGYRFDALRQELGAADDLDPDERRIRAALWGDDTFFYERDQARFLPIKARLYSSRMREALGEQGCLTMPLLPAEKLKGLHPINRRSYVDCKLRLGDHLLADHGDRMALANAVELRHPFLDDDLVDFATRLPVGMKLRGYEEKYILKQAARNSLPKEIVAREKFGFAVPGTPHLLRQSRSEIREMLEPGRIAAGGYFDPPQIQALKEKYEQPNFKLNVPFDDDLLAPVITFGLLQDIFDLPAL
jgi:asparagine synthase (glutamine-hydrolysing)